MRRWGTALVVVVALGASAPPAAVADGPTRLERVPEVRCDLAALPGLSAYFSRLRVVAPSRGGLVPPGHAPGAGPPSASDLKELTRRVGAWQDWGRVADAVLGAPTPDAVVALADAMAGHTARAEACRTTLIQRDRLVAGLLSVGYGPIEVADITSGRLTRLEVDRAYALKSAGHADAAVAFLERALASRSPAPTPRPLPATPDAGPESAPLLLPRPLPRVLVASLPLPLDSLLVRYALANGVDPALARAVIAVESRGRSRAVSMDGALGLMQLMPATAAMLGVNPLDPLDNLRAGLRYLGGLLREYGSVRDALVAYNAGPTHATRVRRGQVVLYGETRRYLEAIARHYPVGP